MPRVPKPKKPKAPRKKNEFIEIVKALVEIPPDVTKSFWPREVKLAKDLCNKHGLEQVKAWKPQTKYPSIAYLVVAKKDLGEFLQKNWKLKNMSIPKRDTIQLEDDPVGEPANISNNTNTIKSWLEERKQK